RRGARGRRVHPRANGRPVRLGRTAENLDRTARRWMAAHGSELLRISLGIVFLWFGLLKVLDRSPVADLVALTLSWFPADVVVPVVGAAEVVVGLGLLFRVALRLTLLVFWGEMLGTFLVLFLRPELA